MILRKHEEPEDALERRTRAAKSARNRMPNEDLIANFNAQQAQDEEDEGEGEGDAAGPGQAGGPGTAAAGSHAMAQTTKVALQLDIPAQGQGQGQGQGVAPATMKSPANRPPKSPASKPLPQLNRKDEMMVSTVSTAILEALPAMQDQAQTPDDLVRLGIGIGISLTSNGILDGVKKQVAEIAGELCPDAREVLEGGPPLPVACPASS